MKLIHIKCTNEENKQRMRSYDYVDTIPKTQGENSVGSRITSAAGTYRPPYYEAWTESKYRKDKWNICVADIRLWASSEADCEYPLWLSIKEILNILKTIWAKFA